MNFPSSPHVAHRGLEGRALKGLSTGGRCFGYQNTPGLEGVKQVVDETEAIIVRRIFQMCAEGGSLRGIAKTLNAEGVPSVCPRTGKKYAARCPSMIHEMLRRERYIGRIVWNRSRFVKRPGTNRRVCRPGPKNEWSVAEVPELRIMDSDLWARVQDRLIEVKKLYGNGGGNGLMNRATDRLTH